LPGPLTVADLPVMDAGSAIGMLSKGDLLAVGVVAARRAI